MTQRQVTLKDNQLTIPVGRSWRAVALR